jgi:thiamine-phosphate pyrophosphorylase
MERLQYISQETDSISHIEGIQKACDAGVKWIQLRIKEKTSNEILSTAKQAKEICDHFNAKLTVNDLPKIARQASAYGVHLGKEDITIAEARKIVGDNMIIGGTANTIEEIEEHFRSGANYVGVGPFRFTNTKKNLSPVLGLEGYRKIMEEYSKRNISIPVIAIGGIQLEDISDIMGTGVYGIAVSGLIANAADAKGTVKEIFQRINASIYPTC